MSENYALELLEVEQSRCTNMIQTMKEMRNEGYNFSYSFDIAKYEKQLDDLNKAIELLKS